MPSFDQLLRLITPRYGVPFIAAAPLAAPQAAPHAPMTPATLEPMVDEPGYFRQALIEARLQWARDVQRAAEQPARISARVERVVFTDQYIPPPPRRPSMEVEVQADAVGWWD
jgi:hypothetical protein